MEISDSFGKDNYYYLMPKTLHESPIHSRKLMILNPECIGSTFNKLHEIESSQLLEKQLQVLLSLLKEGYEVTCPDYWTSLLDLCTNKAQLLLSQFIEYWLAMLVKSSQLLPKEKQQKITDFIQKNGDSIDQSTNSQIQNVLVDVEKQISVYEYQLWSNYRKQQNESFSEKLKTLSNWLEKMTPEGMEAAYLKDKDNNEILLSYDMEYTNQLYESLDEPEITNSLLQLISENSDNYYVEGAAGLSSFSCFLTNRRHYKNYLEDIKAFCNGVHKASIKYKDEMLKN